MRYRNIKDTVGKLLLFQLINLLSFFQVMAQAPVQQIRGRVFDEISRQPLPGAQVFLQETNPLIGTVTDEQGYFTIEEVPAGRYIFVVTFIGYKAFSEDFLVKAGNDPVRRVALLPAAEELEQVTIKETPFTTEPLTNIRKITVEQSTRFAANYLDPARVMTSFPGIMVQNDQNNNLVINGKSPNGLLWRLEGFDVVNPNHLTNAGTLNDKPTINGGGVNMLSAQMLGQINFVTTPFRAAYGNAYSGIMDLRFRDGNKHDNEFTAQASLIGLDLAAEGPLKKGKSSFLANYRYSTVGLLTSMGIDFGDEEISFQDVSFKLAFDHEAGGSLSVFGFAGNSSNDYFGVNDPLEWKNDKDSTEIFYTSKKAAVGFKDVRSLNRDISLNYGSTISYGESRHNINSLLRQGETAFQNYTQSNQTIISTVFEVKGKLTKTTSFHTGLMNSFYKNEFDYDDPFLGKPVLDPQEGFLWQPYFQATGYISSAVSISSGIRYMKYSFNNTDVLLPNFRADISISANTSVYLNYGRQGKVLEPELYQGINKKLELITMHHTGLGMQYTLKNHLLSSELFYEKFSDVPVSHQHPTFSTLNNLNERNNLKLVSEGSGEVYGINFSLEQPFIHGFYYVFSGALYESTYKGYDGVERSTRFNGNYQLSATTGWEFLKNRKAGILSTISLDLRGFYAGGLRTIPIDREMSELNNMPVFNYDRSYSERLGNYKRLDTRLSWRREKSSYTRVLAIDIQNILNIRNDGWQYFDHRKGDVVIAKQLGIIPIIVYRIEF